MVKEPYALKPRQLDSGRWKGRVVRYDPETGKRIEMNRTFDMKKEAKAWAETEAATSREDPNRKPPSEETFAHFFEKWLQGTAGISCSRYHDQSLSPLRATIDSGYR